MKTAKKALPIIIAFIFIASGLQAQGLDKFFREIILKVDTGVFSTRLNMVKYKNDNFLYFEYTDPEAICEGILKPYPGLVDSLSLTGSGDFEVIDSLMMINEEYYRFKIQFNDLSNTNFLTFNFNLKDTSSHESRIYELKLLPVTNTFVKIYPLSDELFIGEEKIFEMVTNNIDNIRFNTDWQPAEGISYRVSKTFNQLQLHLLPNGLGKKQINIPLQVKTPFLINHKPVFDLPPVQYTFNVKESRLQFLTIDRREVTLDDSSSREGILIQIDNSRLLRIGKTYRIEDQENPDGTLIAEIFTRNLMANNRVLCRLRLYNYHRESEGYLYIKDGDQPMFITNFNITPKTQINRIRINRDGNWTDNLTVYPGETIDVRIEGLALHKARFTFEELVDITPDTSIRNENLALYKFRIPMDISKNQLNLYNHGINTGRSLAVKEYQKPRPLDFIMVNYDGRQHRLSELQGTYQVDKTISDVIFSADQNIIDSRELLYGKQYLKLEIIITNKNNELLEMKTIDNIVICPGTSSPRYEYYSQKDCNLDYFNLNRYLRKKTHTLDLWSQINIKVSHQKDKYGGEGFTREFDLVLRKDYSFDIEVSFPAGLITVSKPNEGSTDNRFGQLTGISIAMIAQFTFYHPEKINTARPYKIGAGFLALNTFNFSDTGEDRDIGVVILGSLYPTTKDVKLTFPLYFGGGYLLKDQKFFFLLGPGIRIRL